MNDHKITASWTTVAIRCGGCHKTWEQPYTDPEVPAVNVCPYCVHAAPTAVRERVR